MSIGHHHIQEKLEHLIDRSSVTEVLQQLVFIANTKAEHVRANWQDENLAKRWERAAKGVDSCIDRVAKTEV